MLLTKRIYPMGAGLEGRILDVDWNVRDQETSRVSGGARPASGGCWFWDDNRE